MGNLVRDVQQRAARIRGHRSKDGREYGKVATGSMQDADLDPGRLPKDPNLREELRMQRFEG